MLEVRREINANSRITLLLFVGCILAVITYVYFLNMSVVHVVLQKETIRETQDMKNHIALLEANYIEAQHTIAARMATMDGLMAERNKTFVERTPDSGLVLNQ